MSNINNIFTKEELARYNRHIIIPGFGMEAQKKLKSAKVLVIGSGGLGSPVLLYLAAAGVGPLGIVDFDVVDDSNLQRQVLFGVESVGTPKVEAARDRLIALNPHLHIRLHNTHINSSNALDIIKDHKGFIETGRDLKSYDSFNKIWKQNRDPYLLETSCPGIFAAGDVRAHAMNRVAAAVGEVSMAISFVHKYLAEVK